MGKPVILEREWVQVLGAVFLLVGLFIALFSHGIIIGLVVMFLSGLVAGKIWFLKRYKEQILPYVLIVGGFLLGALIGSVWSSRLLNVILFIAGAVVSYKAHQKGFITFKSLQFVK